MRIGPCSSFVLMIWVAAFALLAVLPSGMAVAQTQGPEDIAEEEARAKASLYRLFMAAEQGVTANQDDYDATYYEIDLDFNTSTNIVSGTVEMRAVVTGGSLTQVELNFSDNMTVSAVTSGGSPSTWTHPSDILRIDLDKTV